MNLEIAQRLQQLRKQHGYSQEGLAEKLGLSRQAVSKWERAESAPDTDNLIELARLYGVSIDELLLGRNIEAAETGSETEPAKTSSEVSSGAPDTGSPAVDAALTLIPPDTTGTAANGSEEQPPDRGEESCKDDKRRCRRLRTLRWYEFPYPVLTLIGFLIWGFCGGWASSWTLFLTVPLYYTLIDAIQKRNAENFCYPVFVVFVFCLCGTLWGLWHPMWVLFLTIPIYYGLVSALR